MSKSSFEETSCAVTATRWARAAALAAWIGCGTGVGGAGPGGGAPDAHAIRGDAPSGAVDAVTIDASAIADGAIDPGDGGAATIDPASPGAYGVHVDDGKQVATPKGDETITVFAPSSDGGATIAAGSFPLVIVSTGYMIGRGAYAGTCKHLATWGYVVISHDYAGGNHQDHAAGVSAILDWALGSASGLAAHVDAARIATAGHSMGGKVSILAAILDPRVKAVVGWDPVDALPPIADGSYSVTPEKMASLTVPLAVLGETTDGGSGGGGGFGTACAPVDDNYHQFFAHACASPASVEITIDAADHTEFVDDPGTCGLACLVCTRGTTAATTVVTITRRVTVAWLEARLRGVAGMEVWWSEPQVGTPTEVVTQAGC